MKLVMAIVGNDDSRQMIRNLTQEGFSVTKLASTGGFLMSGNTTIITGVEDEQVDEVVSIISETARRRSEAIPVATPPGIGGTFSVAPMVVQVGGATIFVLPVDRHEKV